jgi:hypothetical protein
MTEHELPRIERGTLKCIVLVAMDDKLFDEDERKILRLLPDVSVERRLLVNDSDVVALDRDAALFLTCDVSVADEALLLQRWLARQPLDEKQLKICFVTAIYSHVIEYVYYETRQILMLLVEQFDLSLDVTRLIISNLQLLIHTEHESNWYNKNIPQCGEMTSEYGFVYMHRAIYHGYDESDIFQEVFNKLFV